MKLADRLRAALAAPHGEVPVLLAGDVREPVGQQAPATPAAVLVAVTDRPDPGVILTQRADLLRRHAGQIAFPGGRIDDEDQDAIAAALREAEEEIGLSRARVEVIGLADSYRTITGFEVNPVIGIIAPDLTFTLEPGEVAAVFEVPWSFVLDPANHIEGSMEWQGHNRHFYEIVWEGRRIWGATAAMFVNLSRRLQWTA